MSLLPRIASPSRREQTVLRCRYGLDGPVQTLRGLGAELGISAEHVRQFEQQALDTLHAGLHAGPDLKLVRRPAEQRRGCVALMAGR
jgi:DNA-directed RNA polymerase sigma subunit (sigma70/sigma32)